MKLISFIALAAALSANASFAAEPVKDAVATKKAVSPAQYTEITIRGPVSDGQRKDFRDGLVKLSPKAAVYAEAKGGQGVTFVIVPK